MKQVHSRESLIRTLKQYAATHPGKIGVVRFCAQERIATATVGKHFKGGFRGALAAAGLEDRMCRVPKADRATVMPELHRVAAIVGRTPTKRDMMKHGRIGVKTIKRQLGPWTSVQAMYERWTKAEARHGGGAQVTAAAPGAAAVGENIGGDGSVVGAQMIGVGIDAPWLVGVPLGFRGLLHGPVNELGVVHLFGLLAPELGIVVEHIGASFPDCRGFRPERTTGRWRRIAIEFELKSSGFKTHNHDPSQCDLIVCWEHDWEECPLEVMELKAELAKARKKWEGRAA